MRTTLLASISVLTVATAADALARDQIRIVGSSTVFPFTTAAAEQFGNKTDFATPVVESTGSGGGLKLFCAGVGVDHPDMTNASRRIKPSEVELCGENGVSEITEVKVGFDGIVLANSKEGPSVTVTRGQLFQALAAQVEVDGELVDNPYTKWSEIDSALPDADIEVLGPPPTSGTRDAFVELVMHEGCETFPVIDALEGDAKDAACETMREDGAFVEAGENDNLIVQKLKENPAALGIFGFSFLDQNLDVMQGSLVDGVEPTFEAIADGSYPVSRSLFVYVKSQHVDVIPGIEEFLAEYTSDGAMGEDGYLADKGLIPLPEGERDQVRSDVANLVPLKL